MQEYGPIARRLWRYTCQTSTMGSVALFSLVPHLPSAEPCFWDSVQGCTLRTVYSCIDGAMTRVLTDAANRSEMKLTPHTFSPSFSESFSIPPQAHDICNRYVYWMDGWVKWKNGWMDGWMKWSQVHTAGQGNCLIHCLPQQGIKKWYSLVVGKAIKIKNSKPFLGIYPRDIFVCAWNDICIRLFHCSFKH